MLIPEAVLLQPQIEAVLILEEGSVGSASSAQAPLTCQTLYFCTSKASKVRT
jgi:hypothetical protein